MAFVAWAAPVNYPNCMFGSHEGCTRAGIELIVIPIGLIAGALFWRRLELAIRLEASRIGPWLPTLGLGVLLGALLVLFWTWGDGYRWYGPAPLSAAAVLAAAAFVVGRFHPRTSAVLAFYIGVPAILAASTMAVCGYSYRNACAAEGPIWGGVLIGLVALLVASALMRRWMVHGAAWAGLVAYFFTYVGLAFAINTR